MFFFSLVHALVSMNATQLNLNIIDLTLVSSQ